MDMVVETSNKFTPLNGVVSMLKFRSGRAMHEILSE